MSGNNKKKYLLQRLTKLIELKVFCGEEFNYLLCVAADDLDVELINKSIERLEKEQKRINGEK